MSVQPYRCPACGRLLFKSDAADGRVQIACPGCRAVKMIDIRPPARLTPAASGPYSRRDEVHPEGR